MKNRIPPPLLALLIGGLMWGAGMYLNLPHVSHNALTVFAIVFALAGVAILLGSVLQFKKRRTTVNPFRAKNTSTLVTSGMNSFTRNPMYLGMLLLLIGWTFHLGQWPLALGPIFFMTYMTQFQIKAEEAALKDIFGKEYDVYLERVRRWL